ncbi:hypothetical protein [Moorena sp. SIOASIH]|nr:hypothetical protein [Moorena sp. SIOASIH]
MLYQVAVKRTTFSSANLPISQSPNLPISLSPYPSNLLSLSATRY